MGKMPADDVLPAGPTRRSLAGRLSRAHRAAKTSDIDSSIAPRVGAGNDVSIAARVVPAPAAVDPAGPAQQGLATSEELRELASERDAAKERVRAYRSENVALRQTVAELEARSAAFGAEDDARTAAFLEVRARSADAVAAVQAELDESRAEVARLTQQLMTASDIAAAREGAETAALRQAREELAELRLAARRQSEELRAAATAMSQHEDARARLSLELSHRAAEVHDLRRALEAQAEQHAAASGRQSADLIQQVATLQEQLAVARGTAAVDPAALAELRAELASVWAEKHELEAAAEQGALSRRALEKQITTLKGQVEHLARERDNDRRAAAEALEVTRAQLMAAREEIVGEPVPPGEAEVLLREAELKLTASEGRRRAETARVEALEQALAQARAAGQDAEGGRRVAAQRYGEQKLALAQLKRENDALRGLVDVGRRALGAPELNPDALAALLPRTLQQLKYELEVAKAELASRDDRIRNLEIAAARAARSTADASTGRTEPSTRGESILARLRDITQDADSASA